LWWRSRALSRRATPGSLCSTRPFSRLHLGVVLFRGGLLGELDPLERVLALDDPESAVTALLLHEVVELAGLAHAIRYVRRDRRRHLAVLCQAQGELRLLDRGDH